MRYILRQDEPRKVGQGCPSPPLHDCRFAVHCGAVGHRALPFAVSYPADRGVCRSPQDGLPWPCRMNAAFRSGLRNAAFMRQGPGLAGRSV